MAMQNPTIRREDERNAAMHLIVSDDYAPAIKWITSPLFKRDPDLASIWENGIMFKHQWGGLKNEDVVIPMGRIVALGEPTNDYIMEQFVNTIILPGMYQTQYPNWFGIAPYNLIDPAFQENQFGGNQPGIRTNPVIEIPYTPQIITATSADFFNPALAKAQMVQEEAVMTRALKNPWGALINNPDSIEGIQVRAGDYVRMTPSGRFCKWIRGTDDPDLRVGKILSCDWNQKKHGLLNWILWGMNEMHEDAPYNRAGFPGDDINQRNAYGIAWPYDPSVHEVLTKRAGYISPYMTEREMTGIPGLHDGTGATMGFGINDTFYSCQLFDSDDNLVDATFPGIAPGNAATFTFRGPYGEDVGRLVEGSVTMKTGGVLDPNNNIIQVTGGSDLVSPGNGIQVFVDHFRGRVTIVVDSGALSGVPAGMLHAELRKAFVGVPTYADFVGVVGTVKIQMIPH